jgi:hypothetical protein
MKTILFAIALALPLIPSPQATTPCEVKLKAEDIILRGEGMVVEVTPALNNEWHVIITQHGITTQFTAGLK